MNVRQATLIIANAAPDVPARVPVDTPEIVAAVQMKLRSLGYVTAGPPDGELAQKTESAILDFRNRNGLPTGTSIDGDLLNALLVAGPKLLPESQVTATESQIAPKVASAKSNLWSRFWAKVAAVPALAVTIGVGIINNLGDAINALTPLKSFLSEWLDKVDRLTLVAISAFLITVVSGLLWFNSRRTGEALTQGFREGTVLNDKDKP